MKKIIGLTLVAFTIYAFSAQAQRKVLIEQFTNSGCPPCAVSTPVIASYVNNNLNQVLMLAYHTSYPYLDSMYFENAFQSDQRVSFYNVGGVPYSVVDGNYYKGSSAPLVSMLSSSISNRAAVAPRYNISFISTILTGNTINLTIAFQSTDSLNQNENLVARVVVAEKNVLKSSYAATPGYNNETEYPWVVRRMLPDENGTYLYNKSLGSSDTVSLSWTANNFKDLNEMRVVAFVQNANTDEIYQSEIGIPGSFTSVNTIEESNSYSFTLYPVIASANFKVQFLKQGPYVLKIYNAIGKLLYKSDIKKSQLSEQFSTQNFKNGIYYVVVESNGIPETKRLIINK